MRSCVRIVPALVASAFSVVVFACAPKEDTFDPDDFNTSSSSSSSSSGGSSGTSSTSSSGSSSGGSSSGSASGAGSISLRFTSSSDCLTELPITKLDDDNPGITSPQVNVEYEDLDPGMYQGTIDIGTSTHGTFKYTLAAPPAGMHRQYLMNLLRFDQKLNHCVYSGVESTALKYTDFEQKGGPIYVLFTVTSPCAVKDVKTSIPGQSAPTLNQMHGPIRAGNWDGSFYWYDGAGSNANGPNATTDCAFFVKTPPVGTKRTVQIKLVDYATNLNHCVYGANTPVIDDQPDP